MRVPSGRSCRSLALVVVLAALAAVVAAASSGADSGGRLVVSQREETRELTSIDPLQTMDITLPSSLVYDPLLRRGRNGELQPALAESVVRVAPNRWRARLRTGVRFHDGSALDAADVVATVQYVLNPASGSGYLRLFTRLERAEVVDPRTVDFVLRSPNSLIRRALALLPILSSTQLQAGDTSFKTNLIGTGAYRLASWRQGDSVLLQRNDGYWGRKPAYREVLVRTVPEPATRLADLLSGGAGIAGDLLPDQAARVREEGLKVVIEAPVRTAYFTFTYKPPLDDARVRRALYHALDRAALARALYGKYAEPAISAVPQSAGGFAPAFPLSDYSRTQARALLQQAGVTLPLRITIDATADMVAAASLIQAQLEKVGIALQINVVDSRATLFDANRMKQDQNGRLLLATALDNRMFDALRPFEAVYGAESFFRRYGYQPDAQVEALIQRYAAEGRADRRGALSLAVQQRAKEQMPAVWLYFPKLLYGVSRSVCWDTSGSGQLSVSEIRRCI